MLWFQDDRSAERMSFVYEEGKQGLHLICVTIIIFIVICLFWKAQCDRGRLWCCGVVIPTWICQKKKEKKRMPLPNQLIWAICGPTLGMIWDKLWTIYGCYMVLIWAMASHTKSINATVFTSVPFHCLSLWDCYVFRKVPYIPHSIWYGNDMG